MSEKAKRKELLVSRHEAGRRLDLFLVHALPSMSRKQAKRLIDGHQVSVNGRIEPMASRELGNGEKVVVALPEPRAESPTPAVWILQQDDDFVAVLKPAGLPSGPTRDKTRPHAEKLAEEIIGRRLTLLHRLDKDTTGVLLLAKTRAFGDALLQAFRARQVEKVYLALVRGHPPATFDRSCYLREGEGGRMLVVRSGGMASQTSFRTRASKTGYALVEAHPSTGRTHQIRVHLAEAGFPILGDALYGGDAEAAGEPVARHMLHAWLLEFDHPTSGVRQRVEAPVPDDLRNLAELLFGRQFQLPQSGS